MEIREMYTVEYVCALAKNTDDEMRRIIASGEWGENQKPCNTCPRVVDTVCDNKCDEVGREKDQEC